MGAAAQQDMTGTPPWLPSYGIQASRLQFATVADAHAARFLEWDELHSVLRNTCQAPPQWSGTICGNHKACTSCKLQTDEAAYNPLRASPDVLMGLYTGLRHFDHQAQALNLIGPTFQETVQAVLSAQGHQLLPPSIKDNLKDWGYLTILGSEALELLRSTGSTSTTSCFVR